MFESFANSYGKIFPIEYPQKCFYKMYELNIAKGSSNDNTDSTSQWQNNVFKIHIYFLPN